MFPEATTSPQETIRSKDVIIPALLVMAQAERLGTNGVTSAQVHEALESAMVLSEADREKQPDRTTRFSRTVRNTLVSHKTLERQGLAKSVRLDGSPSTLVRITTMGQALLCDNMLGLFGSTLPSLETLAQEEPKPNVVPGAPRVLESSLINLSLLVLALAQKANGGRPVNTTLLRRAIKSLPQLSVSEEDTRVLAGRKDTKLDQVLRNLLGSHETLTRPGLALRSEDGLAITPQGKVRLLNEVLLKLMPAPPAVTAPPPRRSLRP